MKKYKTLEDYFRAEKLKSACFSEVQKINSALEKLNATRRLFLTQSGERFYLYEDAPGEINGYFYTTVNKKTLYDYILSMWRVIRLFAPLKKEDYTIIA